MRNVSTSVPSPSAHVRRTALVLLGALFVASLASVSAHVVRGLAFPGLATAFVSSPSAAVDAPIPVGWGTQDTGLRVVCFNVANTSLPRVDRPGWPRITGVGFELPGKRSGFALVTPLDDDWELVEGARAFLPGHGAVTLDVALVASEHPRRSAHGRPHDSKGIPPGQLAARGSGTRFCVSGPFPDSLNGTQPTTIEQILNGVVVGFHGVEGHHPSTDVGVWDNAQRIIPLYPN